MGHRLQIHFSDLIVRTIAPANNFVNCYFNYLINGGTTTVRHLDKNGDRMQTTQETVISLIPTGFPISLRY